MADPAPCQARRRAPVIAREPTRRALGLSARSIRSFRPGHAVPVIPGGRGHAATLALDSFGKVFHAAPPVDLGAKDEARVPRHADAIPSHFALDRHPLDANVILNPASSAIAIVASLKKFPGHAKLVTGTPMRFSKMRFDSVSS